MEEGKRIRLVFREEEILSEAQKLDGLSRSWVLLKPHHHDAVSDLASHLLHAFQLHQSCPHGLLLSISGYFLPLFESTQIIKDNEIISVRRRKDVLSIEGTDAANDFQKLKALEKQPVNGGVLILANEEFEKEQGGYESDESGEESKEEDESLLEIEDSSGAKANKINRKRKASERLQGYKENKQRLESKHSGNNSSHVCAEKKVGSLAGDKLENVDDPAKDSDNNNVHGAGVRGSVDVQEKYKETEDAKVTPKETKKVPSRSARRKHAKRQWLREMAKIQKLNATCESEGLRNWKEDQAKSDREKLDCQWKVQQKWGKNHADAGRTQADGQLKGLLHRKMSSQNTGFGKGKRHKHHTENGVFLDHPNRNGDMHKQQNRNGHKHDQVNKMSDITEQPLCSLNEQPGQNNTAVQEQNSDASMQSNCKSAEENIVIPIEIRPGHIRFEPLEEEEQAKQQDRAPLETFNWNGITSKKKGQQLGKENHRFTPLNDDTTEKGDSETLTIEKERGPNEEINFDKLPPLPGIPKKGDLVAYRVLELSSTWTPDLSAHRVGKVSWYNTESNQTILLPVPEYPIVSKKDDADDSAQPDNSLYKEDGSLEIDFLSLIDVRVLSNEAITSVSEASAALPGSNGKPASEPSPGPSQAKEMQPPTAEIGGSIWERLSVHAKKEQLAKENGWGSTPKKVVVQPSPGSNWGKKPQPSSWGKQSTGSKSWSYKALRGSALGPTMAMLRSQNDT